MIDTAVMDYNPRTKVFVTEASTIGLKGFPMELDVKSHRTGKVLRFFHENTQRDPEGDLLLVSYTNGDVGCGLIVFND